MLNDNIKITQKRINLVKSPLAFLGTSLIIVELVLVLILTQTDKYSLYILVLMGLIFIFVIGFFAILVHARPSTLYVPRDYASNITHLKAIQLEKRKTNLETKIENNRLELLSALINDKTLEPETKERILKLIIKSGVISTSEFGKPNEISNKS